MKWEVGMRPPAHRGLRLRPGGKSELKAENRGQINEVGSGNAEVGIKSRK